MAKISKIWAIVLSSIVSGLGFTSCSPKMYGPEQPAPDNRMFMYGPAPMEQYVPSQPSAEPIAEAESEAVEGFSEPA